LAGLRANNCARLRVPKLRRQTFETAIIERYRRREASIAGLGLQAPLVVAGSRITTSFSQLVALALQSRLASASNRALSVSSTVPRTTRSSCPLDPLAVDRDTFDSGIVLSSSAMAASVLSSG
jgi:hypothetical protein